jgi:hypothetical protein
MGFYPFAKNKLLQPVKAAKNNEIPIFGGLCGCRK